MHSYYLLCFQALAFPSMDRPANHCVLDSALWALCCPCARGDERAGGAPTPTLCHCGIQMLGQMLRNEAVTLPPCPGGPISLQRPWLALWGSIPGHVRAPGSVLNARFPLHEKEAKASVAAIPSPHHECKPLNLTLCHWTRRV